MSKVITIAQQKGGSGKTTIAANLATVFSLKNNFSTTLLDTDPQGSLGKWFMTRKEKLKDKNTLQFKTASLWGAQYEAKTLKEKCDIVIIDTPPKIDADGRPAIEIADLVLIPISPSQVDFWATESIIELAKREKKEIFIIGGGKVYEYALTNNLIDIIYLTRIHAQVDGDTFFPKIDMVKWQKISEKFHPKDDNHKYDFTFLKFEKKIN